jgi:hypothetical protein
MSAAPVGGGTNGLTTYEADCVGTGLGAGQIAPLIEGLDVNTTADTLPPTGATFGVNGTASSTLIGPVVAGIQQVLNSGHVADTRADSGHDTAGGGERDRHYRQERHQHDVAGVAGDRQRRGRSLRRCGKRV